MNYKRLYDSIIENRKQNPSDTEYTEVHHIIPRSLGGSDKQDNLVKLSAREHFICHYLLAKMYPKNSLEWYKMNHAFMMMKSESCNHSRYYNSRLYEALKNNFSSVMSYIQSGENNSQYGMRWIHNMKIEESKKIPNGAELPTGWHEGRIIDFKKHKEKLVNVKNKKTKREEQKKQQMEILKVLYERYKDGETIESVSKDYHTSCSALLRTFKRHFPLVIRESGRGSGKNKNRRVS